MLSAPNPCHPPNPRNAPNQPNLSNQRRQLDVAGCIPLGLSPVCRLSR